MPPPPPPPSSDILLTDAAGNLLTDVPARLLTEPGPPLPEAIRRYTYVVINVCIALVASAVVMAMQW